MKFMDKQTANASDLGFVVIGRNEGDRLKAGLRAIQTLCPDSPVVYVDSGSTDDSVAFATSLDMAVVELDLSIPFTAARARNAGFDALIAKTPGLAYVQFMDGDCEVQPGWIEAALDTLATHHDIGIVSGRRVEKFPEASTFNTLIDIEWDTPIGERLAVLGDMCVKVAAVEAIEGFSEQIIAAEDDDFCLRARRAGYKTYRIDATMSYHDANIMHLSQWYRRAKRAGHGYANINRIHGNGPEKYFRRELISVTAWGGCVPIAFLAGLVIQPWLSVFILALYAFSIIRSTRRRLGDGDSFKIAATYSVLIFTGKIAEFLGVIQYWKNHLLSRKHQLIEYK
ncbi:MAG: glycosyl transferase [Alteromonadaceae bacterium]|nr:MAG: glycosyl transferase [Alteromonadaceae bacterium]